MCGRLFQHPVKRAPHPARCVAYASAWTIRGEPSPVSETFGSGPAANVGQDGILRPIVNRAAAGPRKLLGCRRQSRLDRIHLDVIRDPPKLRLVANQPIVALVLPERLSR